MSSMCRVKGGPSDSIHDERKTKAASYRFTSSCTLKMTVWRHKICHCTESDSRVWFSITFYSEGAWNVEMSVWRKLFMMSVAASMWCALTQAGRQRYRVWIRTIAAETTPRESKLNDRLAEQGFANLTHAAECLTDCIRLSAEWAITKGLPVFLI